MFNLILDSFWRAFFSCFHPRWIVRSLLPLALLIPTTLGGLWLFGDDALLALQTWLADWSLSSSLYLWLERAGQPQLRTVIVPLLRLLLVLPLVIVLALLTVSWLLLPTMVRIVARIRFPALARSEERAFWRNVAYGLGSAALGLIALVVTVPLWLIPPLVLILPPLIWGWLSSRVLTHDALSRHASVQEWRAVLRKHRFALLAMGWVVGFMGGLPGMVWMAGAVVVPIAPLLMPLAVWTYTFVFMFAALWFTHYSLAALALERASVTSLDVDTGAPVSASDLIVSEATHVG